MILKLTDPDGGPIWIVARWVTQLKLPPRGQYSEHARTLIVLGAREQAVRETPEEIVKLLKDNDDAGATVRRA